MSEDWGPWIEHDGTGCPVRGQWVEVQYDQLGVVSFLEIPCVNGRHGWKIGDNGHPVIRYRVRKPRGLTILEELLANIPEEKTHEHSPMENPQVGPRG